MKVGKWVCYDASHTGPGVTRTQVLDAITKPLPLKKGERWETRFSTIGSIAASFE